MPKKSVNYMNTTSNLSMSTVPTRQERRSSSHKKRKSNDYGIYVPVKPFFQIPVSPQIPSEYIKEIYSNYLQEELESEFPVNEGYMENQKPEINERMRTILIDWVIEVHQSFKFAEKTLFLAILLVDTYLSYTKVKRIDFQLVGVTSLFIAAKFEEIAFPKSEEFAYLTDNAYSSNDILIMESKILQTIKFSLMTPTAIKFFEVISVKLGFDNKKTALGKYIMEVFLYDIRFLKYQASVIGCACAYIVMKYYKMANYSLCYDSRLYNCAGRNCIEVLKECAADICYCVEREKGDVENKRFNAAKKKYSTERNFFVGEISLV